jgi:hypothetical protein
LRRLVPARESARAPVAKHLRESASLCNKFCKSDRAAS